MNKRIKFLGAGIDPFTMDETIKYIEDVIRKKNIVQHVVINVSKLIMMQKNAKLQAIVNSCDLINADGQGIVWGARLLGFNIPERVAGIDLFLNLVSLSVERKYRVYFLGAGKEIIEKVVQKFQKQYPDLQIAGYHHGYFTQEQEFDVVSEIRKSQPDMLFVAMISPEKEYFLKKNIGYMKVPFSMGVGGSFDIVAGKTKRAPKWMQTIGLEWFFRFLCEPKRMWKRYLISNFIYVCKLLREFILIKIRGNND